MNDGDLIDYNLGALFLTPVYTYYDDYFDPPFWTVYEDESDVYYTLYRNSIDSNLVLSDFNYNDEFVGIDNFNPY